MKNLIIKPPFTKESALAKVKASENLYNTRDPEQVVLDYTIDSEWRIRDNFFQGHEAIKGFLERKWKRELDFRLMKELWSFTDNRISVRFEYEWHDAENRWFRTHGNEHWEFDADGLINFCDGSMNDIKINPTRPP